MTGRPAQRPAPGGESRMAAVRPAGSRVRWRDREMEKPASAVEGGGRALPGRSRVMRFWGVFDRKEASCGLLPVFASWTVGWAGVPRIGLGGANRAEFQSF